MAGTRTTPRPMKQGCGVGSRMVPLREAGLSHHECQAGVRQRVLPGTEAGLPSGEQGLGAVNSGAGELGRPGWPAPSREESLHV